MARGDASSFVVIKIGLSGDLPTKLIPNSSEDVRRELSREDVKLEQHTQEAWACHAQGAESKQ